MMYIHYELFVSGNECHILLWPAAVVILYIVCTVCVQVHIDCVELTISVAPLFYSYR